jgi:hypothetical protein
VPPIRYGLRVSGGTLLLQTRDPPPPAERGPLTAIGDGPEFTPTR